MNHCKLCTGPIDEDADHQDVCYACGYRIAQRYTRRIIAEDRAEVAKHDEKARQARADRERREVASRPPIPEQAHQEGPVVYYVRLGTTIKIGFSTNLRERLRALRATPSDLLAVEPGGRDLEQQRHQQFNHLRVTPKREDFHGDRDLRRHIGALRALHGMPAWLSPPRINRRSRNTPVVVRKVSA